MSSIPEIYGSMVFNDRVMRDKLPKDIYIALKKIINDGKALDLNVANSVATAMKDWATEKGATHFTHWFQPMTGITAEKHDSFITPTDDGGVIMEFSGKSLIKGEPDASSFPSGGLRATFEARGYTAWDPTSYAFIKEGTLCIPTAFCSYGGEVLDKKTPLLRSMDVLGNQALKILKLFGHKDVQRVITTVGAEQEYFLIDSSIINKRPDLKLCGRTLIGSRSPKGEELEDHYFGNIKTRVKAYMKELDEELWMLGIAAKTEHNEVAPAQHELAPIYTTANIGCDHNQLTMELMKKVAERHGLVCLLHEKPFAGMSGSGKHNNWSLQTDTGKNLLEPGKTPESNMLFLLLVIAVVRAVDEYADMLRVSVATAGNDHRLGSSEAPPSIVSVFLGDELNSIFEAIESGADYIKQASRHMNIGASSIPTLPIDTTDRNRTSPFAFTGNKFEFRMLGSNSSIAGSNIVMNTAVAEVLSEFAAELEKADNFDEAVLKILSETYTKHKRVLFNGDGYADEWKLEAEKRGLPNFKTTPEAIPHFLDDKNVKLFEKHKVFTKTEISSRCEVLLDSYIKNISIEANTMLSMIKRDILPAVSKYSKELCDTALCKMALDTKIPKKYETEIFGKVSELGDNLYKNCLDLEDVLDKANNIQSIEERAVYFADVVLEKMNLARKDADELETVVSAKIWPYPIYSDILFST